MADTTISALPPGTPAGSGIVPYSTGTVTLGVPVSAIFHNAGNIGIGTASPAGILDVRRGASTSGVGGSIIMKAQEGYAGSDGGNVLISSGPNGPGASNGYVAIGAGASIAGTSFSSGESMRIASSGNVGIGTVTPVAKLDVYGNVVAQNGIGRRTNVFGMGASVKRRITVSLTNYSYARFKLYALRSNSGDSMVWWEGILNNNFGYAYNTTISERRVSGSMSYTLQSVNGPASPNENTAPCLWHFDMNSSISPGIGHYDCSFVYVSQPAVAWNTGVNVVESTWT